MMVKGLNPRNCLELSVPKTTLNTEESGQIQEDHIKEKIKSIVRWIELTKNFEGEREGQLSRSFRVPHGKTMGILINEDANWLICGHGKDGQGGCRN